MRVSSTAAEAATSSNGHQQNSPALEQLRAAIDTLVDVCEDNQATAILEAGEEEEQELAGPSPSELFEFDACHDVEEVKQEEEQEAKQEEVSEAHNPEIDFPPAPQPRSGAASPTCRATYVPAPYDPIAELEEEIAETSSRIVACSVEISELDAKLKQMKKSWKTASDELVALHLRKGDLLSDQREKEKRTEEWIATAPERVAATAVVSVAPSEQAIASPATSTTPASPDAPESTKDFHTRIDAAFAPTPGSDLPPTPEQEAWDRNFRAVRLDALDGITPKILEILEASNIRTIGDWQDVPARLGIEYTQLSGGGAKLTEARFEKVMGAMLTYMNAHPRPAAADSVGEMEATPPAIMEAAVVVTPDVTPDNGLNGLDIDDI